MDFDKSMNFIEFNDDKLFITIDNYTHYIFSKDKITGCNVLEKEIASKVTIPVDVDIEIDDNNVDKENMCLVCIGDEFAEFFDIEIAKAIKAYYDKHDITYLKQLAKNQQKKLNKVATTENKELLRQDILQNLELIIPHFTPKSNSNHRDESLSATKIHAITNYLLLASFDEKQPDGSSIEKDLFDIINRIKNSTQQVYASTEFMTINRNLRNTINDKTYRYKKLRELFENEIQVKNVTTRPDSDVYGFNVRDMFDKIVYDVDIKDLYLENNVSNIFINISFDYEEQFDIIDDLALYLDNQKLQEKFVDTTTHRKFLSERYYEQKDVLAKTKLREGMKEWLEETLVCERNDILTPLYISFCKYIGENMSLERLIELIVKAPIIIHHLNKQKKIRQIQTEKRRLLLGDLEYEKSLEVEKLKLANITDGYGFEKFLKHLFERVGYKVSHTKQSGDQGADLIVENKNIKYAVQAKFYTMPVGNYAVQAVVGAKAFYNVECATVITNSTFTPSATSLAEANGVVLIDGERLSEIIECVSRGENWNFAE